MPARRPDLEPSGTRTRVGVVTGFERVVWATALAVRETEFGEILRRARLAPNSTRSLRNITGWTVPEQLLGWELSYDPALHRTIAAVFAVDMLKLSIPTEAGPWVLWVTRALEAMQRIAAKCWGAVPADVRRVFLDFDDLLAPATQSYIANLRLDQPDRPALRLAGLDSGPVQTALGDLFSEVEASATAVRVREVAKALRRQPSLMHGLTEVRARLETGIRSVFAGETGGQGFERAQRTIATAYDDRPDLYEAVSALRTHNRQVTRIAWSLLGAAEQMEQATVTESVGAIGERVVAGERHLDLTVKGQLFALIRPTNPVWLQLGTPLDGLYIVERHTLAFGGAEENDLGLVAFES